LDFQFFTDVNINLEKFRTKLKEHFGIE